MILGRIACGPSTEASVGVAATVEISAAKVAAPMITAFVRVVSYAFFVVEATVASS